jgi:putative redox protein
MAAKTVYLDWDPEKDFILRDKDGLQLVIKKPKGVSASDLLPMSLIGCSSFDVVEILQKQRQLLRELKVTATATQDENPPWRFRKIHIHYKAVGQGLELEKVLNAILLSQEHYCSVYVTLRDAIEITHDVEVVEG